MHVQWSRTVRGHAKMQMEEYRRDKETDREAQKLYWFDLIRFKVFTWILELNSKHTKCEAG